MSTWDLVLIGCGAKKGPVACAALDLYTGPVYRAHRDVAEYLGLQIDAILSAKYGVLPAHHVIDPYEARTMENRSYWHTTVLREVRRRGSRTVLVLAGKDYVEPWAGWAREHGVEVDDPLRGLHLGGRRQFVKRLQAQPRAGCPREQLLSFAAAFHESRPAPRV